MNSLHNLRTIVRQLKLQRLVTPLVAWLENRRLSRLGNYDAKLITANSVELNGFGKTVMLSSIPAEMVELALSTHERPTLTVILSRLQQGAVVWDVGANIGFYTRLMSTLVGENGRVIAFEPSPETYAQLVIDPGSNVTAVQKGLSDHDGSATFATSVTHSSVGRIVRTNGENKDAAIVIEIAQADTLVESGELPAPNFLKIDVEGHELSVVKGMKTLLSKATCKGVIIEIHFSLLEKNGLPHAYAEIEKLFQECGLTKQQWIARSHLLAERC